MGTQIDHVIDLNPHYLQEVLRILSLYVPDIDVRAFGSRVKWTAKAYSDLDLALMTQRPMSLELEAQLREAFDESTIPFKVDFVDWAATSKTFQSIISADSVLIRHASTRLLEETWTVMSLEDALDALLDYRGKTPDKTNVGVPLITAKIVKNGRIEPATEFIAAEKYGEWMTRGLPRVGDVLLTTEAPLGEVAQLHTERVALAQRLVALRGKAGVLDNTYLCYLLQTSEMQEQLAARATGTTVLGIKQSELRKIAVRLPSFERQRSAAAVLASLDDRITLLRETNTTLEAIAQALFKSWFVDFDPVHAKMQGRAPEGMDQATAALFPDSFEESELGVVPKGWQVMPIGDAVETFGGATPDTKTPEYWEPAEHHWTTPKDLSGIASPVLLGTERKLSDAGIKKISSGLLPVGSLLMSSRAPIGYLALTQVPMAINQGYIAIPPGGRLTPLFMLFWCQSNMDNIKGRANGSTFMEISKKAFRPIPALVPIQAVLDAFDSVAVQLFARLVENEKQAQNLASLRDTLLPRLISGQLCMPEVETTIDGA